MSKKIRNEKGGNKTRFVKKKLASAEEISIIRAAVKG